MLHLSMSNRCFHRTPACLAGKNCLNILYMDKDKSITEDVSFSKSTFQSCQFSREIFIWHFSRVPTCTGDVLATCRNRRLFSKTSSATWTKMLYRLNTWTGIFLSRVNDNFKDHYASPTFFNKIVFYGNLTNYLSI